MSDPIVGIDLGTSNTVVSHADASGIAVVLADASGFKIHPSVVSFHPSGGVVVGAAAKQRKVIDPKNTIYSVKRLIGRSYNSREVQTAKQRSPFQIKEGANQLPLIVTRGGEFAVPEISAIVLDHAKNVATSALQTDVSRAVVTVPASFNDAQRSATATAGSIAGLTVVRVRNEPTAAALAYGNTRNLKETIAVYDFGGGTFDITILKLEDQVYEVLGTSGDSFLGGDDLDERIVDRMVDKFLAENRVDLRTNEVSMMRLRAVAEQTKIELSRRSRAVVRVDEIAYGAKGKPLDLQIEIRREEFVSQVSDIIDKTFPVCEESLKLAGLSIDQIDDVILVGGTTKIPYVRDQVTKFFARAPRTDVSPEDAVSVGAALQATALERILKRRSPSRGSGVPSPIGVSLDDEGSFGGEGVGETATFNRDELTLDHEETQTRPEPKAPPARTPAVVARPTERPVERGKHHDVFEAVTPQPPPPNAPVIGRITKQVNPMPAGAKTVTGMAAQAAPPSPPPTKTTAPRVTVQRPPAVPSAAPQAKTLMIESPGFAGAPIAQQSTVIIDQDALSPAMRGDEHLDLDDDFGFPNLTTEKGFLDLDDMSMPPSTTARGFEAPPAPQTIPVMPAQRPPQPRPSAPPASPHMRTLPPEDAAPRGAAPGFTAPAPFKSTLQPDQTSRLPAASPFPPSRMPLEQPGVPRAPEPVPMPMPVRAAPMGSPVVLDVTPRGLGIGTVAGFCEELIRRNSRVPTEMRKLFVTSRDDQDSVRITVVQGESRRMAQNTVIADLRLERLPRRPRGETSIEVTFMLDANGILQVHARDAQTGQEQRASLDIIGTIPQEDVSASRERLQALRR